MDTDKEIMIKSVAVLFEVAIGMTVRAILNYVANVTIVYGLKYKTFCNNYCLMVNAIAHQNIEPIHVTV